jgi:WD40 repeat protein
MWRIALAFLVAFGLLGGALYYFGLWPLEGQTAQAQNNSSTPSSAFEDYNEVVTGPVPNAQRVAAVKPPLRRLLNDPITIFETTINLVEEQDVSSRVESGLITDIYVRLGQKVSAYMELARLDDRIVQAVERKQGYIAKSEAKVSSSRDTYITASKIAGQSAAPNVPLAEREKMVDKLNASRSFHEWVQAYEEQIVARLELERIQTERENYKILSQISGEVTRINKNPGEPIRQGEILFHIVNLDRLRAEGAIPVQQRSRLRLGMRATLEPEVENASRNLLRGHTGAIRGLAVTPDGRFLASASEDATTIIWDLAYGRRLDVLRDDQLAEMTAVAAGPVQHDEGAQTTTYSFLTGRSDGGAQLWRFVILADGRINKEKFDLGSGASAHRGAVRTVAISPNGERCATAGEDKQIYIWQMNDGKFLYRVTGDKEGRGTAHRGTVTTLHFTPDGHLVSAATDKTLKKWRLGASGAELVLRQLNRVGDVEQLGISTETKRVLFDNGTELRLLDLDTFDILETVESHRFGAYQRLALFSPSGRTILTATANGRLQLLNSPATVDEATFFRVGYTQGFRRNSLLSLAALTANLAPSGHLLFPAIAGTSAQQPTRLQPPQMVPVLPSMVVSATQAFPLWFVTPNDFRGMTAVPELWNLNSYELRHLATPDAAAVTCGAFSPDETMVFTAGTDKVIRIWEMPSLLEQRFPLEALVMYVGNQVDSSTNLVRLRAEFENPPDPLRRLMPGTRVNLTLYPESAPKE